MEHSFWDNHVLLFLTAMPVIFIIIVVTYFTLREKKRVNKINAELQDFLFRFKELKSEEFLYLRNTKERKNNFLNKYNDPGVYILNNKTIGICYVGQGKNVLTRVNAHFTGKGNGDVYADYKYGSSFTIQIVPLKSTNYTNLNDLEREYIRLFDSYVNGYNKTRGNS